MKVRLRAVISLIVLALAIGGLPQAQAGAAASKVSVQGAILGPVPTCRNVITNADQYAPAVGSYSIHSNGVRVSGITPLLATVDLLKKMPGAVYNFRIAQDYGVSGFAYCKTYPLGLHQAVADRSGHVHYSVGFRWNVTDFKSNAGVQILVCPVGPGINPDCTGRGGDESMPVKLTPA